MLKVVDISLRVVADQVICKFYKLPGNKGYEKCIQYNKSLVAPHEFESMCGMKAMKVSKKIY